MLVLVKVVLNVWKSEGVLVGECHLSLFLVETQEQFYIRTSWWILSKQGIQLEMPEALQVRRIAVVRSSELGISANVSVRHCNRAGSNFLVGMEFTGGTYPVN